MDLPKLRLLTEGKHEFEMRFPDEETAENAEKILVAKFGADKVEMRLDDCAGWVKAKPAIVKKVLNDADIEFEEYED